MLATLQSFPGRKLSGFFHSAGDLRRVFSGSVYTARKAGTRIRHQSGDRKLLRRGLWGLARHSGYLGEGFLSFPIGLVFDYFTNPWAWTSLVFFVSLCNWRQRLDDSLCAEKYGAEKWTEYQA